MFSFFALLKEMLKRTEDASRLIVQNRMVATTDKSAAVTHDTLSTRNFAREMT